jgi:tetratricopeptide (TPR) repeat protein
MTFMILAAKNFFIEMKNSKELFLEKLIRLTVYLGVLFLPLFFIPLGGNLFEFSKVVLFYVLVLAAVVFWLIKIYIVKKINLQFKFLDILLILLASVYFISSVFSVDSYNSLFGKNLSLTNSFTTLLFLLIFYFIVSRFFTKIKYIKIVFNLLTLSILLILLSNIIPVLPVNQGFIFGLSINSFNLLLIFAFIACGILFLISQKSKLRYWYLILAIIFVLSLFFIDNQYILLVLALAIFIFIFLLSFKSAFFPNKLVVSLTLLLFITVIILILPINRYTGVFTPLQFNLPNEFAWDISKATLADNLLFAVGPQNFVYSFYKYKPVDFNQTSYWQLGFTKSANFWLEISTTAGFIATLIFLAIFLKFFQYLFSFIKKTEIEGTYFFKKYLIAVALSDIICLYIIWGFFDNFHFIVLYFLFLFLALVVSLLQPVKKGNTFSNKNVINLFSYILAILLISVIYFVGPVIMADIYIEKVAAKNYQTTEDFDQANQYLAKAILYNPQRIDYYLKLANLQINKLSFLKNLPEIEFNKDELEKDIFNNLALVFNSNNQIIDNYLGLRQAYNSLTRQGYQVIAEQEQVNIKLLELDPNNPELYIDRALINFSKYTALKESGINATDEETVVYFINQIKTDIEKSITLKDDFVLGYYNLGLYWQEFGEQEQALESIYMAYELDPSQQLIVLSLKKLYLNQDKVNEAIEVLKKYLELKPEDHQVRIELAIIYKNDNNIEQAKEEINTVLNQAPEHDLAKKVLVNFNQSRLGYFLFLSVNISITSPLLRAESKEAI